MDVDVAVSEPLDVPVFVSVHGLEPVPVELTDPVPVDVAVVENV